MQVDRRKAWEERSLLYLCRNFDNLAKGGNYWEIKMIANQYDFAKEAANSIYAVSSDEAIKLQCEARERYERDWESSYKSGFEDGIEEGIKREKKRADSKKSCSACENKESQ